MSTLKLRLGDDVRRVGISHASELQSRRALAARVASVYGVDAGTLRLRWQDEDGDLITIANDADLAMAAGSLRDAVLRLEVDPVAGSATAASAAATPAPAAAQPADVPFPPPPSTTRSHVTGTADGIHDRATVFPPPPSSPPFTSPPPPPPSSSAAPSMTTAEPDAIDWEALAELGQRVAQNLQVWGVKAGQTLRSVASVVGEDCADAFALTRQQVRELKAEWRRQRQLEHARQRQARRRPEGTPALAEEAGGGADDVDLPFDAAMAIVRQQMAALWQKLREQRAERRRQRRAAQQQPQAEDGGEEADSPQQAAEAEEVEQRPATTTARAPMMEWD